MEHSTTLKDLAPALVAAQKEMGGAAKDSNNPFFKSNYADLTSVWRACKDALHNNGFSVIQSPVSKDGRIGVSTMLLHSSGQYVYDEYTLGVKKQNDPQADGSSITYARRYALAAFVGVCPVDDDGNAAAGQGDKPKNTQKPKLTISPQSVAWLRDFCKEHKIIDPKAKLEFQKHYGFDPCKTPEEEFLFIKADILKDYNEV